MTTRRRVAVFGTGLLALAAQASASDISWTFQRVDQSNPGPSPMISLGMRTGATWPTVFYENSQLGLTAASLTPVGWAKTQMDTINSPSFVRSATGSDGRVGAAWQFAGSGTPRIQFGQLTSSGWQYSTVANLLSTPSSSGANAPDVAYLPGNRPVVAYTDSASRIQMAVKNANGWESETVSFTPGIPAGGQYLSTAVNSQGDIGLVYYGSGSRLVYAEKSIPGGSWRYADLYLTGTPRNVSLAYGPHDEAGVVAIQNTALSYYHFDTQSGVWQADILETMGVTSTRVDLVFNSAGNPCLAYVASDGLVHYRTNNGNGWLDIPLPTGQDVTTGLNTTPLQGSDAALALDRDGIPVISYYTQSGLVLAYDPIITPEPGTLLAVTAGIALISRRRRQG